MKLAMKVLVPFLGLALAACDVTKTEEGKAPDVEVEGGNLPEYDVNAPDVSVGADTTQVVTPDVDIKRDTTPDTTKHQ